MGIKETLGGIKDKAEDAVEGALEKTDIDDKIKAGAEKIKDKAEDAVEGALEKTDIDDKIKDKVDEIKK